MMTERVENIWIEAFSSTFQLCGVKAGDVCVILSETQSRPVNVQLAELALLRLGGSPCHVIVPTPRGRHSRASSARRAQVIL